MTRQTETFELSPDDLSRLPIFPLPNATLFPRATLALHVFEPRYRELVRDVLAGRQLVAVPRLKPGFESEYEGAPPVYELCGAGRIVEHTERSDGRYDIVLQGVERVRISHEHAHEKLYRVVRAERVPDVTPDPLWVTAWQTRLLTLFRELGPHLPPQARELGKLVSHTADAAAATNQLAAAIVADPDARQALLEERDPGERLRRLVTQLEDLFCAVAPERGIHLPN